MTLSLADGVILNVNRGVSLASGGGVATITNTGTSVILSVVSGNALTKSGSGTLTLIWQQIRTQAQLLSVQVY